MDFLLSRDSVAAGDDLETHDAVKSLDTTAVNDAIGQVIRSGYLPTIQGGKATWVVVSAQPIAVCAQQWSAPKMLSWSPLTLSDLARSGDRYRLHFSYLAQLDPELALEVLKRCRFSVG